MFFYERVNRITSRNYNPIFDTDFDILQASFHVSGFRAFYMVLDRGRPSSLHEARLCCTQMLPKQKPPNSAPYDAEADIIMILSSMFLIQALQHDVCFIPLLLRTRHRAWNENKAPRYRIYLDFEGEARTVQDAVWRSLLPGWSIFQFLVEFHEGEEKVGG